MGRVVLITGAAGAIGSAAARRFVAEGASVALLDVDGARAASVAAGLGGGTLALPCDVGDEEQVARATQTLLDRFGRLDVVFNNAGVSDRRAPIHELGIAEFDRVLRANLRGAFLVLGAGARAMVASGRGGAVVNMSSSMAGWDVLTGGSAYAASKHGILGLTRTAALDLAPHGVRVNAVCPGVVQTTLGIPDLDDGDEGLERFRARIPLRRVAHPDDVAAVVAFLASDDARHVTGSSLLVDGGQTLQSWANSPDEDRYPTVLDVGGPTQ